MFLSESGTLKGFSSLGSTTGVGCDSGAEVASGESSKIILERALEKR
jgi:hypothetical protein